MPLGALPVSGLAVIPPAQRDDEVISSGKLPPSSHLITIRRSPSS
jgi:hypothetical protein